MVQPKYSPEEALEKMKLMMKYDSSKTLNENKKVISEQLAAPAVAGAATGAVLGAGAAASGLVSGTLTGGGLAGLATSAGLATGAVGTAAATAGFAIVGGAVGLGLLPLVYWLVTKDTGMNKVKKMFEMCSTESAKIAKLPRKLQDTDLRSISDDIEDAVNYQTLGFMAGTDEEKLFSAFKQLESGTASDFCALIKYYNSHSDSGDLFDDLDSDIDAESEWKQIYRPIRNCVEDSLLTIKDDSIEEKCKANPNDPSCNKKVKKEGESGYKPCTGTYQKGCKSDIIAKVQGCLGLVTDGKFGPKTQTALSGKGFTTFTDADVTKICEKTVDSEISGESPADIDPSTSTDF